MDMHDDTIDELSGDGTIIIEQAKLGAIYCWLSIVPVAGPVVAEGSITGPEEFMRMVMNATGSKLVPQDGYVLNAPMRRRRYRRSMGESPRGRDPTEQCNGPERCPQSPALSVGAPRLGRSDAERNW
jgi:hypothetical protein